MYFKNHKGFIYIAIAFPESIQYQNITQWYLNLFNYKKRIGLILHGFFFRKLRVLKTSWIINWFTDFKKAHKYLTWKKNPIHTMKTNRWKYHRLALMATIYKLVNCHFNAYMVTFHDLCTSRSKENDLAL